MVRGRAHRRERRTGEVKEEVLLELAHGWWQYAGESVELVDAVISADRQQMTFFMYIFMCVHGLRSPKPPHHTYTLGPLQPTAHLASMEYPLNISLYSLSTHHSSRFPLLVHPRL